VIQDADARTEGGVCIVGLVIDFADEMIVGVLGQIAILIASFHMVIGARLQVQGDRTARLVGVVWRTAMNRSAIVKADLTTLHQCGRLRDRCTPGVEFLLQPFEVTGEKIEMVVLRPFVRSIDERNGADGLVHGCEGYPGGEHLR